VVHIVGTLAGNSVGETIIVGIETDALAARFRRFAERECEQSPLYWILSRAVAADRELLGVAAAVRHGPVPNLFLAAVHDLLLRGQGPNLAAHYQTVVGAAARPPAAAPTAFRDFVLSARDELAPALARRLVQTNEVRRAAVLNLALCWLRAQHKLDAVALVEVGTSAGLLLATDRYGIRFGPTTTETLDRSALAIESELRGNCPIASGNAPAFVERIGLDLATLDLSDEADRRWLRALVWGDQPERLVRLNAAIEVARSTPMTLHEGDANELLPEVLDALPERLPAIVFHSHTLNQFSPAARERFDRVLLAASGTRELYRISMEGRDRRPTCTASVYRDGDLVTSTDLAHYDAHGAWIAWLT